jgi:hypothetical protein
MGRLRTHREQENQFGTVLVKGSLSDSVSPVVEGEPRPWWAGACVQVAERGACQARGALIGPRQPFMIGQAAMHAATAAIRVNMSMLQNAIAEGAVVFCPAQQSTPMPPHADYLPKC